MSRPPGRVGNDRAATIARRASYVALRRAGACAWDAACDVGLIPSNHAAKAYERFYQALRRGETPLQKPAASP